MHAPHDHILQILKSCKPFTKSGFDRAYLITQYRIGFRTAERTHGLIFHLPAFNCRAVFSGRSATGFRTVVAASCAPCRLQSCNRRGWLCVAGCIPLHMLSELLRVTFVLLGTILRCSMAPVRCPASSTAK